MKAKSCAHLAGALGCLALILVANAGEPALDKAHVADNLKRMDQLDFDAYSEGKDMKLFRELHCADVKVVLPDGSITNGIDDHMAAVLRLFNGTPDSRITEHPIAFGAGDWTATAGSIEATFSEPMRLPGGRTIAPTGGKVRIPFATLARWKEGCVAEEHLFFDSAAYWKQLGLPGR